jgi:peptidoglycan/LPS O-acetylase OafA/YrhL
MFSETKYRRDIQVLRGLAVLAVVLFHVKERFFPLGYLGVDVFFVISGFVVTPLILRIFTDQVNGGGRLSNLKFFYKRRFYRLAPALAVTLTISAVTIFLLGPLVDHQRFARQGIATLLLAGNVGAYRYSGDYFSPNPNPLLHTWSLSVEEQIYIFLPLILILILRNRKSLKKITAFVLGVISAVSFVSFLFPAILQPLYSRAGIALASQFSFYSPIDRIWQFTAGGLAYLLLDRYHNRIGKIPKSIQLLTVIAVAMILFGPLHMNLKVSSLLASFIAVIVILFKSLDVLPDFLIKKLEWLGDRSYSIYLVHMPLLYIAKYSPVTQIGIGENRIIQSTIAVVASILLGSLSYSKIENRFRNNGKSKAIGLKAISSTLILTLVTPLVFFVSMDRGVKNQYWGLQKKIDQPPVAWNLDGNCSRMSGSDAPPCIYKTRGANKTVLLIGDSHAAQFSPAIVEAAKKAKWNSVIWALPGCYFILSDKNGQINNSCLKRNNSILKWVKEFKPSLIIISQYNRTELPQAEMKSAVITIKSLVPNLLVVGNTPIFLDKRYMASPALLQGQYNAPKQIQISNMDNTNDMVSNSFLQEIAIKGIETVNLNTLWCNLNYCNRFDKQGWLFFDVSHLSVFGAEMSVPYFTKFLNSH